MRRKLLDQELFACVGETRSQRVSHGIHEKCETAEYEFLKYDVPIARVQISPVRSRRPQLSLKDPLKTAPNAINALLIIFLALLQLPYSSANHDLFIKESHHLRFCFRVTIIVFYKSFLGIGSWF